MRNRLRIFPILVFATLAWGFPATTFPVGAVRNRAGTFPTENAPTPPAWEVSGVFSEACECTPPCPCWSGEKPTQNHCHNLQVFKIEKGHYGAVSLDNLIVVSVWVSPEGKTMVESAGQSVLLALYLDRSINAAQRVAVEKIWDQSFNFGAKGKKGGLKAVRFQAAEVGPDRAIVTIPGILTYEVRKGNNQPVKIQDSYIHGLRLASSVHYRYSDYGMTWDYPGKHAAFATFHAQPSPLPR
jgi:hypothetical protein